MKNYLVITILMAAIILGSVAVLNSKNAEAQEDDLITVPVPVIEGGINGAISSNSEASALAAKFVRQVSIIERVTIPTSLFESKVYQSLIDQSRQIPDESVGRPNPFAPFGL